MAAFSRQLIEALEAGDVAAVQLRLKDAADDDIVRTCRTLAPIAQDRNVAFILNDRPDLAAKTGCDGVHIGQDDVSYGDARKIVGGDAIVGVTCHNVRHLAMVAAEAGADYVAFGAFFPSQTKEPPTQADPDILAWWNELMTVPCVAIGGITVHNCAPLIEAGADFLAVSAGVWAHENGPSAAVRTFNERCRDLMASHKADTV